jgi:arginyl-tRNA synthetase
MEDVIRTAVADALIELGFSEVDFSISHPENMAFGDYACNVAMVVAKEAGKAPREIAGLIQEKLEGQIEYVEKIEVAGAGFLNFTLSRDFFTQEIMRVIEQGDQWGSNRSEQHEVVFVEYTSPNLFKPLHIGNLVGNIIGESISRLFTFSGAKVVRCNYPSDIGLTVAKGVWGLQKFNLNSHDILALGEAYKKGSDAYEKEGESKNEIIAINQALYAGIDEKLMFLRNTGIATSKARLSELCRLLGTEFDVEILESEASVPGLEIVKKHTGDIFEVSEGAVVYKGEKVGLHTRVFINSKGLPTYEAKDIGHFTLKSKTDQHWTRSVIVTGNEQSEYFKVVFAAIKELFPEVNNKSLEHIPTGFLTLTTGKMSSRKGNVLTGESLLEEMQEEAKVRASDMQLVDREKLSEAVAVGALKYQILRHGVGSNIIFDKEQALSFEGNSGPYLQYTHARICSAVAKAQSLGIVISTLHAPEIAYGIERLLYRFTEVIEYSLQERQPNHVATYITELASAFNGFYAQEKIADATDEYAPYKVALVQAVAQTLKNGLWVLGIKAPISM